MLYPAALPRKRPSITSFTGGWVGLEADLEGQLRPANSEMLYSLRYPGRQNKNVNSFILHTLH